MSNNKSTARASKGTVRNWTEEEKDLVWEQVQTAKAEGLPLTGAFRKVSKILPHRSEAAVGMLYYNVLRKEREETPKAPKAPKAPKPQTPSVMATPEFTVDPRLLEAFQGLPEYIHELNNKMKQFEKRLENPDPSVIIQALGQLVASQNNQAHYQEQIQELQEENKNLQATNETLNKELKKLREAYEDALNIYDMFTNMASISQIMSLGDFKQQMKTTLDKWGNVLDISFDRVN